MARPGALVFAGSGRRLATPRPALGSGELRYREYDIEVGEGKDTVKMPIAEIHAAEIRRLNPRSSENDAA